MSIKDSKDNVRWLRYRAQQDALAPRITPKNALDMVEIAIDEASRDHSVGSGRRTWWPYATRRGWERAKRLREQG